MWLLWSRALLVVALGCVSWALIIAGVLEVAAGMGWLK